MLHIFIIVALFGIYAHLYIHFMVSPNNEASVLKMITKEDITNSVYSKLPFVFDATVLSKEPLLGEKETHKAYDLYVLPYHPIPLLEPFVKFFPHRKLFQCKKKKKWLESNDSCRTFYRLHKGSFHFTCIHPKKKDLLENVKEFKELKNNEELIQLTLYQDSILFLPRDWFIYVEPLDKESILEKIQYYTPLNQVANAISKISK
jgi:hypothetical protein